MIEDKKKIKKGFAVVNIIAGVMLCLGGIQAVAIHGFHPLVGLLIFIGFSLWIFGAIAFRARTKTDEDEASVRTIQLVNTICFVISVLYLVTVTLLIVSLATGVL